ncbi:MAG: tetratricopeptide repeat protein [Planctomycetales bacterium]|nr:tetratricopeptide repeat protein [Planctomycetales bacterium]
MEGISRFVNCWPGLPQLWLQGSWAGLALAIGFSALANVLLLGSFVWTEWLSQQVLWGGWTALVLIWGASWFFTEKWEQLFAASQITRAELRDRVYREAQVEYLQGNWRDAELKLNRLLSECVKDVDARLMLATLKRRTGRLSEAREHLDLLQRCEASAKWRQEIEVEFAKIQRLVNESKSSEKIKSDELLSNSEAA